MNLGRGLKEGGYRFITPTPLTHERVYRRLATPLAMTLRDVFGWSMPFDQGLLPEALREELQQADVIEKHGALWRSAVRWSSLDGLLFAHSPYPTDQADAVFFGPDSYRFAQVIEAYLQQRFEPLKRAVDIGCGAGVGALVYAANRSMERRALVDADGELLIVPQQGRLVLTTEMGVLEVAPGEIALVPRGIAFKVGLPDGPSRGYVCENYGAHFRLPELGPIGSNGLANPRDFQAPVAAAEDGEGGYEIVKKFGGRLWRADMAQSPFNVVAWHGNLTPCKYDTKNFMVIGSISFDHPDPSIFTVLTSPSDTPGTANCDFVIFPPRWLVQEDTFRPPWYHRNMMSEFMGLVYGEYDAKAEGFRPGGASLHNCMVPHGPDEASFEKASASDLQPQKLDGTLAFMFESRYRFVPTAYALLDSTQGGVRDPNYPDCWQGLADQFKPAV